MGGERRAGHPNRKRAFLAGPYTHGDPAQNVRAAIQAAARILEAGHVPYLPHLTHLWHLVAPRPYEGWMALHQAWQEQCDVTIRLPGHSPGGDRDVANGQRLGQPIYYSVDEFLADHPLT